MLEQCIRNGLRRVVSPLLAVAFLPLVSGCIVIPIGDLFKGPPLGEQVLLEGAGVFSKDKIAILEIDGIIQGDEGYGPLFPLENEFRIKA